MRRRDRDELPAIDMIGSEPETDSMRLVSLDPRGPRRRLRGLLIAVSVAGLLVAGLVLDGDDSEGAPEGEEAEGRTTTTDGRTTTTRSSPTTTTTAAIGALFAGQDLRGWLLSGNGTGWTLVEIESGTVLQPNIPFDDPYSTRAVEGGVLTIRPNSQVEYRDLRVPEEGREPVILGFADQMLSPGAPDQVWLIDGMVDEPPSAGVHARLVDLSGRELRSFEVPNAGYIAATPDGLLFDHGGRVYVADESGAHAFAVGDLVGAAGSSALVLGCDDDATCGIDLQRPSGERVRRLAFDVDSTDVGFEVWSEPGGEFAVVRNGSVGGSSVTLFEADGSPSATLEGDGAFFSGPLSWLPGDAGLVGTRDGRIVWIHRSGRRLLVEPLPALGSIASDGVLAIALP